MTAPSHTPRAQNIRLGIVLMMSGLALFTVGEALVKLLAREYEVAQIVWARYAFHALLTVAVFSRGDVLSQARTSRPGLHIGRSALMLVATGCFFTALRYLPLADAIAIVFVAPLLVTALAIPLLGETVGPRRWAAIAVGFAGVMVIIRPGSPDMHWAMMLPLVSASCYALYQVLTRIAARSDSAETSLFWTSAFGVVVMSVAAPFFWDAPDLAGWVMMLALGAAYGVGHYLLIRGLEVAPASRLSPFLYTQIIWATLLGLVIFDQFPDAMTLTGLAIVIASGIYIWRRELKRLT
ncbi:MAG: DMT family transporter [Alphaproteobacteria bacterium]